MAKIDGIDQETNTVVCILVPRINIEDDVAIKDVDLNDSSIMNPNIKKTTK